MNPLVTAFLQTAADPVWVVDRDFVFTAFNVPFARTCEKLVHVRPQAPIGLDQLIDPAREPEANAWWRDVFARVFAGRSITADRRPVLDGVKRSLVISGSPVVGENGQVTQAVFSARDVTDVTRTESEDLLELAVTRLLTSEKPLEDVLADVLEFVCESDGWDCAVIWLVEPDGEELVPSVVWSQPDAGVTAFGERVRELRFRRGRGIPGKAWLNDDIYWVADLFEESGFLRAEFAALAGLHAAAAVPLYDGQRVVGVLEMMTRAVRPMSQQRHRALSRAGRTLGRHIVRRQLHQLIERKSVEWTRTFDAIGLPIFITTLDGTIVRVNRAARDLVGGEFRDVLGRNIAISADEPWKTLADTVIAVRDSRSSCTAQIAEYERFWDVAATWYQFAIDAEDRVIIIMRDTTDVVRMADSVRRGEQMAALGELVAGVAHEVRNPIFGIGITIDALQQVLPPDAEVSELFGVLRSWLGRLNRLMENLLAYGKSWTLVLEEGHLDEVLKPVIEECRQIASQSQVAIDARIEPGLLMLMDAHRLGHAFENVIINAIQHSSLRQTVEISASHAAEDGAEFILCHVRDHGPGFPPLDVHRVFEPFFTKRRGGTGLGLSIVQRVVDEHGGIITAGNAENGGALVKFRFPVFHQVQTHVE